jgi:tRNA threonylcarbamoyladenosine biosynthesis protein TsaE
MFRETDGLTFRQVSRDDLGTVAQEMLKVAGNRKVWLFSGEMGAGKTTLIKELCTQLRVVDHMSSPTFSIINEYLTDHGVKLFHFDFFRLKREAEAYDIGTEDYFYSGDYCFVEWPEKIRSLIPDQHVDVHLTAETDIFRTIAISVHDGKEKNRI